MSLVQTQNREQKTKNIITKNLVIDTALITLDGFTACKKEDNNTPATEEITTTVD